VPEVCALRVLWCCISKWFVHDVSKRRDVISISILEDEATMKYGNVGHRSPIDAGSRAKITKTPTETQQKPKNLQIRVCPGVVSQCFVQPVASRIVDSIYIIRFRC
jgi:hypothetical protein